MKKVGLFCPSRYALLSVLNNFEELMTVTPIQKRWYFLKHTSKIISTTQNQNLIFFVKKVPLNIDVRIYNIKKLKSLISFCALQFASFDWLRISSYYIITCFRQRVMYFPFTTAIFKRLQYMINVCISCG